MEPQGFAKGQAARRKGVRRGHILMNYRTHPVDTSTFLAEHVLVNLANDTECP